MLNSGRLRSSSVQDPLKLVAMGDSFVYGYGDWEGGGWVERLRRHWQHPIQEGHVLYNLGVRGDTVRHLERRLESEFQCRGELRNRQPDGLILSVGANDSARLGHKIGRHYVPLDEFTAAIARIVDTAQLLGSVWFVGMVPVDEAKMPFAGSVYYSNRDQELYNKAISTICRERGVPFLNCFDRWHARGELWRKARLLEDGLHPNVEGHQAVFKDLLEWPEFSGLLEKTGRTLAVA